MFAELTVILKDESRTIKQKHAVYEPFACDEYDPIIKQCIDETLQNFEGEPSDITVMIRMEIL